MSTLVAKLAVLPPSALGQPGRELLSELLTINTDWLVDFEEIDGAWFLVEKERNGFASLTPIEVFDLEESGPLF